MDPVEQADRSAQQLAALDAAVREISVHLDLDRVLQVIVDRVRDLVDAEYAALGTLGPDGSIDRFITSGIDDETRARIGHPPRGRGVLGLIIREARAFRIPDIAADPRRYGLPPHHPAMHAFLGVPVTVKRRSVGNLYLTNKRSAAEFSEDDQRVVEMFALHAGIAIENARLHHQVQRLAVVEERERIGRDLHDGIIQRLYGVTLSLDDVEELVESDPAEARQRVDRAIEALHAAIGEIRGFIIGLRPFPTGAGDLPQALEALTAEFRGRSGLSVESSVDVALARDLPTEVGVELLAIAREALSNVVRHAEASRATLALEARRDGMVLEVADDGIGFDPAQPPRAGHHGLRNMRERSEQVGGVLTVESRPGDGTRIIVAAPPRSGSKESHD